MIEPDTITQSERSHLIVMLDRQAALMENEGYLTAARYMRYAVDEIRCLQRIERQ